MKRVFLDTNILLDKAAGCDVIVTNNKRDFHAFCELPFLTSEEFLLQFDFE